MYCCVCEKKVSVTRGIFGINQHARGSFHKKQYIIKNSENQLHFNSNSSVVGKPKQEATKAEIMWVLRLISKNHSFESISGLNELLQCTFPNTDWLQYFSLSPRKVSYITNFALGPYFLKRLIADITGKFLFVISILSITELFLILFQGTIL